ncbi:MAG TPA: CDP-alcohol phosphatidyltransferase family protein [Firmicutes bacterium]|nr:CDP-alcohol phosphatidyltransferase family protein [Bacillota bacterium]
MVILLERKNRNQNWTIPNLLSVLRILVIGPFAYFFLNDQLLWAVAMLAFSGLSDLFDGLIARKFNQVTELGKMLDPVADKLTQATIAVCLAVKHPILIPILLVFVFKELGMLVGGCILLKKKKRPCAAKWYGKAATFSFYISAVVIVVMEGVFHLYTTTTVVISYVLLGITAVFMIYAMVRYFQIFLQLLHSTDPKDNLDMNREIKAKKGDPKP